MKVKDYALPNPDNVAVEVLLETDFYTEGPVVDNQGNLFFTDLAGHHIWCWKNNAAEIWAKGIRPNGQAMLADGTMLICDSEEACIVHYSQQGIVLSKKGQGVIDGLTVRCPNDIVIDPQSGFYFTDSVRQTGAVFFIGFDGSRRLVADQVDFANGIAITADGKSLQVAESYQNRILKIDLEEPGKIQGKINVFADLPANEQNPETGNLPDGLTFDAMGRLWVAHYGMEAVQVLSKTGELLATYQTGIPLTSNLCFMGADLIVTGGFNEPGPGRVSRLSIFK